jgi:O-antigen/teichoic acid export membrane protein
MSEPALRKLVRTGAGYGLSTLAGPLFTMLLTPVYTRVLAVADYGTVDTLTMLGVVLYMLGAVGMAPSLTALFYAPEHRHEQPQLLASALAAGAGWSALVTLFVIVFATPITRLTLARTDVAWLVQLIAVGLPFGVITTIQGTVLRLHFDVWRSNLLAFTTLLVSAVANVLLVLVLGWGAAGVIIATVAANIGGGIAGLVLAAHSLRARPRWDLAGAVLRGGAPLLPAGLATWALLYGDRLFLTRAVSLEAIGVYAIATKLAALLNLAIEPFKAAWGPLALDIREQADAAGDYARVLTLYSIGAFGLALALSLFAHEILLLVTTPAYTGGADYVWLLVFAPLAGGLTAVVGVGLYLAQRLAPLAWAGIVAALANTALNVLLIPRYGVLGAAVATTFGALVAPLTVAVFAQRTHPLTFRWHVVLSTAVVYLGLVGAGGAVGSRVDPLSLGVRGLLLLAYLPLLRLLGVLDGPTMREAWQLIRQPRALLRVLRGTR